MNSSGIKRGLAATAVAALAVTGIPAIASAATLATQESADSGARGITFRTASSNGTVSVANDGTNTTVSLVAGAASNMDAAGGGLNDGAAVEYVTFAYFATGATNMNEITAIKTVTRSTTGEFQTEWTPPVGLSTTNILVFVSNATGQPLATDTAIPYTGTTPIATVIPSATADNSSDVTISGTAPTVEITPASGDIGYFTQPDGGAYPDVATDTDRANLAGISGTTSGAGVERSGAGLGVRATGNTFTVGTPSSGISQWSGVINVDPAALAGAPTVPDQILAAVQTTNGAQTRDLQGFGVYAQEIKGVSATSTAANPDNGLADVTVTVVDQNGKPVAGAAVTKADANGGTAGAATTDAKGQVKFTGATSGAHSYYVDTTAQTGFNTGVDYQTSVTVAASRPEKFNFLSGDGAAFDVDEFSIGDLVFQVTDAAGAGLDGQRIFYRVVIDPFKAGAETLTSNEQQVTTSTQQGVSGVAVPMSATIPGAPISSISQLAGYFSAADQAKLTAAGFTTEGSSITFQAYVNRDGSNPGQDPADLALAPATVKTGEAVADWSAPDSTDRTVGTTQTVAGSLALTDGTALAGRTLDVTYTPAAGGNAVLAATQPTGTTRLSNTTASVVTDANGGYSVAITDPVIEPQTPETGTLRVRGTATVPSGSTTKAGVGTDADDTITVNWVADATPATINTVTQVNTLTGGATPGRPVQVKFKVSNVNGTALRGQTVTLKTDHGFFTTDGGATPGNLTPATPATAPGDLYGVWKNLGTEITVTTDEFGFATATLAIEKDAGFDDDGQVRAHVVATAGAATSDGPNSQAINVTFSSLNPLNNGGVEVAQSAKQTVTVLPKAPITETVAYDVHAKDQFGNLVEDDPVAVATDHGFINTVATGSGANVPSSVTDDANAFVLGAEEAGDATPGAAWTTESNTWVDGDPLTAGFQPSLRTVNVTVNDAGETVEFYEIDFAASTYSLTHDTADSVKVGTTVIETYTAIDQNGEPMSGVTAEIFRNGPDTEQTGEQNAVGQTNAAGQLTYVFSGTKAGNATLEGLITDSNGLSDGGAAVPVSRATDQVTFEGDAVPPKAINLGVKGSSNGNKDVLKVNANNNAKGLVAKVFVNGKQVAKHKLNKSGDFTFSVKDKNGNKKTKYTVKVAATAKTKAGNKSVTIK